MSEVERRYRSIGWAPASDAADGSSAVDVKWLAETRPDPEKHGRWVEVFVLDCAPVTAGLLRPDPTGEDREVLAAVFAAHRMEEGHGGNGYSDPRESWINCSCGASVWSWQQFYDETDVEPEDAWRAHLTHYVLAAGFSRSRGPETGQPAVTDEQVERIATQLAHATALSGGDAQAIVEASRALVNPSVTPEQVEASARKVDPHLWDGRYEAALTPVWSGDEASIAEQGDSQRFKSLDRVRAVLAALGIEVRAGEDR